jgi:hypothetical protein
MRLPFTLRDRTGTIDIVVDATRDPAALGAPPDAQGLAHCEATITYPASGYAALLGWIQMVRSTDNRSRGEQFEMDPLTFIGEVAHPFGFFGVKPVLFDAPSRPTRDSLDWLAHSFLCHVADYEAREVHALTGFSWGFTIADGDTAVIEPRGLDAADWDQQLDLLHAEHPAWRFAPGFYVA